MHSIFETSYSVPENPPRLEDNLFGVFTQRGKLILILNNSEYIFLKTFKNILIAKNIYINIHILAVSFLMFWLLWHRLLVHFTRRHWIP